MTTRSLISLALFSTLCALTASATAEPYWITYEGNDFPENEGWTRFTGAGGADRWIEDGALVIDSLHDVHIHDVTAMERWMDPDLGELFVAEWRLLVEEESDEWDPGVGIARSFDPGFVEFHFGPESAWNALDNQWWEIEPGVFHTYRFESHNMIDFDFFIDDQLVQEGTFLSPSSNQSFIAFGDMFDGRASLSRWDYVRFGVVPEPETGILALATGIGVVKRLKRREISR